MSSQQMCEEDVLSVLIVVLFFLSSLHFLFLIGCPRLSATNLELDGGGADEEQRLAVPHVHLQAEEGQVAQEAALLPGLEEGLVHPELKLQAWTPWRWRWRWRRAEQSALTGGFSPSAECFLSFSRTTSPSAQGAGANPSGHWECPLWRSLSQGHIERQMTISLECQHFTAMSCDALKIEVPIVFKVSHCVKHDTTSLGGHFHVWVNFKVLKD